MFRVRVVRDVRAKVCASHPVYLGRAELKRTPTPPPRCPLSAPRSHAGSRVPTVLSQRLGVPGGVPRCPGVEGLVES